jgi:hypothetical protein
MARIALSLVAVVTVAGVIVSLSPAFGRTDDKDASIFVTKIPPGYRNWRLVSVAHEEGSLSDIRAILGNDAAIKAYRERTLPFPDGTIIARIAWNYEPSEENNKIFCSLVPATCSRPQSYVAGPPKNQRHMAAAHRTLSTW